MTSTSRKTNPVPPSRELGERWPSAPHTLEERLQRIEAIGQRISNYILFMCQVGSLNGISVEAREDNVTAFYERMIVVEGELRKIQERLLLA